MADKKISLKIAIDGEAAYRDSIKKINSENKTLNAEMKRLQAVYADSANSYDFLAKKGEILAKVQGELEKKTDDYRNLLTLTKMSLLEHRSATEELAEAAKKATSAYKEAEKETDTYKKALDAADVALASYKKQLIDSGESLKKHKDEITALKKAQLDAKEAYKISKESTAKLKKEMDSANASYARNASNIKYCEEHQELYGRQIIESETELINLNREIDKNNTYLQEAATSADGTAHSIDKYGKEVKDAAEDTKSFANAADLLARAIVASGAIEGAEKLRDAIVDTANASIEYESAFAGVRKTVDGTAEELAAISDGIKEMSLEIPMTAKELAGIAENAGQLGIATKDVLEFTKTMAALSVTTNLTAEEAATSLAKFANITKMSADEYSNLGSSIVALGNNFATTEADIVAMATRLASTGEVVGLTEPQILAVATALSSVGIEAEAGGSAFSKLLKTIETAVETSSESVEQFAKISGMSASEFTKAWRDNAVETVFRFIDGLNALEGQGSSAISVLNDLGLTEVRLSNAILSLATSDGILLEALELSNTAWAENTALADEAAIRYETTESKLQLLSNAFESLKITVGDELVGQFGGAIDGLTDLTQAADEYVKKNPDVVAGITAVAVGLGSLAVAGTVIPLISTLWGLLVANPVGLAATAIIGLITALVTFAATAADTNETLDELQQKYEKAAEKSEKLAEANKKLAESFSESMAGVDEENEKLSEAVDTLESLSKKNELTITEQRQLDGAIKTLNSSIPGLSLDFRNLGSDIDSVVESLRTMIKVMNMQFKAEAIDMNIQAIESANKNLVASQTSTNELLKQAQEERASIYKELQEKEEGKNFWNTTIGEKLEIEGLKNDLAEADKLIIQYKTDLAHLDSQIEENVYSIDLNQNEYDNIISEIDKLTNEYEDALGDLGITTKDTGEAVANAFDEFMSSIGESGKKSASALADYGEAFKAGFSVPFLAAINETASSSDEVLGAMMARYRELVSTYGEGSEEVKAFVTGVNTTFAESAGAEDALVEGLKEYGIVVEETGKKAVTSTKATKEAIDEAGQTIIAHADTVKKNLETLSKEYDSAYKSARSSLDGMGGAFESLVFTSDKSVDEMQSNLRTQADYFTGTLNNINNAVRVGFNEELVSSLAEGGKETQGYLQTIMDKFTQLAIKYGENSEEARSFVDSFNEDFERTSLAKDALAQTMAGMRTNFEERKGDILAQASDLVTELEGYTGNAYDEVSSAVTKVVGEVSDTLGKIELAIAESSVKAGTAMQTMRQTVDANLEGTADKGREAGENYAAGLAEGIENGTSEVDKAIKRLVDDTIVGTVNDRLEIRSPSRVGMEQGEFYDEGIAQGIDRNSGTVISANLKMISDLEARSQSAAAAAGTALGNTMAKSMAAALQAGQALRQQVERGELTVDGKVVKTAESVGIPSLTGQAAIDWNNEMKNDFNLPSGWSNQDIVDWLNGGGFHGGTSSSTKAAIDSALKNESSGKVSLTQTTNKAWHDSYVNQLNANKSKSSGSSGGATVVVNQEIHSELTPYQLQTMSEKGVQNALQKI